MFVSYSPTCHSGKQTCGQTSIVSSCKVTGTYRFRENKARIFHNIMQLQILLQSSPILFCFKVLYTFLCFIFKVLAQSGSFETRQLKHGEE